MTSEWGNDHEFWARLLLDTEPDVTESVRDEMLNVAFESDVPDVAPGAGDDHESLVGAGDDHDLVDGHENSEHDHHDPTDHDPSNHDLAGHEDPHAPDWGWS